MQYDTVKRIVVHQKLAMLVCRIGSVTMYSPKEERISQRQMGGDNENGFGVTKSLTKAREYYKKAEGLGHNAENDLQRLEKSNIIHL